jgi:hypothetical protein
LYGQQRPFHKQTADARAQRDRNRWVIKGSHAADPKALALSRSASEFTLRTRDGQVPRIVVGALTRR